MYSARQGVKMPTTRTMPCKSHASLRTRRDVSLKRPDDVGNIGCPLDRYWFILAFSTRDFWVAFFPVSIRSRSGLFHPWRNDRCDIASKYIYIYTGSEFSGGIRSIRLRKGHYKLPRGRFTGTKRNIDDGRTCEKYIRFTAVIFRRKIIFDVLAFGYVCF